MRLEAIVTAACMTAASVAGASGTDGARITDGAQVLGDPAVVAMVFEGHEICTGTLIAPRVVLTAGHCIEPAGLKVFFGWSMAAGGFVVDVADARAHPGFRLMPLVHDLGLVLLAEPPGGVEPVALFPGPMDESLLGQELRLVGFGHVDAHGNGEHIKREGFSHLDSFTDLDLRFGPSPSQTCIGDSGGPAFLSAGGPPRVVGISSYGDPNCAEYAVSVRPDAYAAGFITPYVEATRERGTPMGGRCFYPAQCAGGVCLQAEDAALSYCSATCAAADDCGPSMVCAAGQCRHPLPTPGALGTRCGANLECASGHCVAGDQGGEPTCAIPCAPDGEACPAGFTCATTANVMEVVAPSTMCIPEPEPEPEPAAGCRAPAGRSGSGLAWILAAAIAAARVRRPSRRSVRVRA